MDMPLSPAGRRGSLDAARRVCQLADVEGEPIRAVISSDLGRALFMAEIIAERAKASLHSTPLLREVDFGEWTGLTWQEIEEGWPGCLAQRMADLSSYAPPGGENLAQVRERVAEVIAWLSSEFMGMAVAVVAHAGINRVFLAHLAGLDLQRIFSLEQGFGCINVVDLYPDGVPVIRLVNGGSPPGNCFFPGI